MWVIYSLSRPLTQRDLANFRGVGAIIRGRSAMLDSSQSEYFESLLQTLNITWSAMPITDFTNFTNPPQQPVLQVPAPARPGGTRARRVEAPPETEDEEEEIYQPKPKINVYERVNENAAVIDCDVFRRYGLYLDVKDKQIHQLGAVDKEITDNVVLAKQTAATKMTMAEKLSRIIIGSATTALRDARGRYCNAVNELRALEISINGLKNSVLYWRLEEQVALISQGQNDTSSKRYLDKRDLRTLLTAHLMNTLAAVNIEPDWVSNCVTSALVALDKAEQRVVVNDRGHKIQELKDAIREASQTSVVLTDALKVAQNVQQVIASLKDKLQVELDKVASFPFVTRLVLSGRLIAVDVKGVNIIDPDIDAKWELGEYRIMISPANTEENVSIRLAHLGTPNAILQHPHVTDGGLRICFGRGDAKRAMLELLSKGDFAMLVQMLYSFLNAYNPQGPPFAKMQDVADRWAKDDNYIVKPIRNYK